ncbi:hypothetical protein F8M41_020125 [Gigaspora margarita]|uniref:F-box domain-containing protein n=1 Tax=Gigaspora margarita TaxID=4874 RepID=A0A8H4AIZ1_GIGMA|nr:hypothetical protein F8M41_020125 [Gigaspora margarita]
MASKILMGDVPELMEKILNNLNNEFNSLYSCALVNRHWCKMTIPILWQNPFSFNRHSFIPKYFSSLEDDEKFILKECGIDVEFPKTIFEYARFLKVLNLSRLESQVKKWIGLEISNLPNCSISAYSTSTMYHLINLLFKLFIESGATLYELDLNFSEFLELKPEIFYSLGQNDQFFSRLHHLSLDVISDFNIENLATLLSVLAKNATKINTLELEEFYSDVEPQLFHSLFQAIICIIKSQDQLSLFSVAGGDFPANFHGIISALESQKYSLQEVIIESCGYSAEFEILKSCKNLESLRVRYCGTKLLKVLDCKITSLEISDCPLDVQTIIIILKNTGTLLQRLKLEISDDEIWEESLLLEALKSFCSNITYLNITNIGFSTQLIELIGNLQNLQFLTLWFIADIPEEELKIRVMQFAEILPPSLQYLELRDEVRAYVTLVSCEYIVVNC